jgi:hypothetical protein
MPSDMWIPIGQGHEVNIESSSTPEPSPEPVPQDTVYWRPMAEIRSSNTEIRPVSAEQAEIAMRSARQINESARRINEWSSSWNTHAEPMPNPEPITDRVTIDAATPSSWRSVNGDWNRIYPDTYASGTAVASSDNNDLVRIHNPNTDELICKWTSDGVFIFEKVANKENTLKFIELIRGYSQGRPAPLTDVKSPDRLKKPDSRSQSVSEWKHYSVQLENETARLRSLIAALMSEEVSKSV